MSVEGLEMLGKHMAYYDFAPDRVLLLGNVLYYAKKAEVDVAELEAENAKLRELVRDFDKCLDTALYLADSAGYPTMPDQKLFASLRQRMSELGVETDE